MKKPPKKPPLAKPRNPAGAGMGDSDALLHMLQQLFEGPDAVVVFGEYLQFCRERTIDADQGSQDSELCDDLVSALNDLRIHANGGDTSAQEEMEEIHDLLDEAIESSVIQLTDLIFTGKILHDAGWDVPESLRQATGKALWKMHPGAGDDAVPASLATLIPLPDQIISNPFEVHEFLSSIFAAFPTDVIQIFCQGFASHNKPEINRALAGFILHRDSDVARTAASALAFSAKSGSVESSIIERLVRIRPWLPPERQSHVDAAITAMRKNAGPAVKPNQPKIIKCVATVCDGSGTRSVYVTQRQGTRYQLATVMIKSAGIADAMVLSGLTKSDMDRVIRQLKSSVMSIETELPGIARMLELALGENAASGQLPPFKLIEVVESLGLGSLQPSSDTPGDIIAGLLADVSPEDQDTAATARAHQKITENDFVQKWFEVGKDVEDLLYPVRGHQKRVTKLMNSYLPARRQFWARQCAISALALRGEGQSSHSLSRQLALVGRDIASSVPLDQIPLMQHIAQETVRSFEAHSW